MKGNLKQLFKRFRLLALISLFSSLSAYLLIRYLLFPSFMSGVCQAGDGCGWGLLEGYASMLTLVILVGGLVFTVWEYSRQESQISFQIYQAIHTRMTNPAEEAARRWIFTNIKPLDEVDMTLDQWLEKTANEMHHKPDKWDRDMAPGHQAVKTTLNTLDYVGFIAENYVNVEGPLLEWMSPPIAKVWERLAPYVEHERESRGEPDYYKAASAIGEKCVTWRKQQGLRSKIIERGT